MLSHTGCQPSTASPAPPLLGRQHCLAMPRLSRRLPEAPPSNHVRRTRQPTRSTACVRVRVPRTTRRDAAEDAADELMRQPSRVRVTDSDPFRVACIIMRCVRRPSTRAPRILPMLSESRACAVRAGHGSLRLRRLAPPVRPHAREHTGAIGILVFRKRSSYLDADRLKTILVLLGLECRTAAPLTRLLRMAFPAPFLDATASSTRAAPSARFCTSRARNSVRAEARPSAHSPLHSPTRAFARTASSCSRTAALPAVRIRRLEDSDPAA